MSHIAEQAGMSRPALYQYFQNKGDIFACAFAALVEQAGDRALAALFRTARIRRIYQNWFGRYGEPLSPIVEAMYQFQAVGE